MIQFTKRIILEIFQNITRASSTMHYQYSSIFDPCGHFLPFFIPLKLFLHKIWIATKTWNDEAIELREQWIELLSYISKTQNNLKIPRYFTTSSSSQLHCFVDASQQLFSFVIYIRTENNGNIEVNLLFAKTRLRPLSKKQILSNNAEIRVIKRIYRGAWTHICSKKQLV